MECPIRKGHDCAALDMYHQDPIYYPLPCQRCGMNRIVELETKIAAEENKSKKKFIVVVLELDTDDEKMRSDEFIEEDLKREINCASNFYDVKSVTIEEV